MRVNDREIQRLGETVKPTLEGVLHHMKPQSNEWSDWYAQQSFKQRQFKLVANLLFYYRVGEQEPLGILVLENAEIAYEKQHRTITFAFSITFRDNDKTWNQERKHIFSCRNEAELYKWVSALREASYEHWRSQLTILRTKIQMRTGTDPLENYFTNGVHKRQEIVPNSPMRKGIGQKKSTFHSHVQINQTEFVLAKPKTDENVTVGNLIDL